MAKNDEPTIWQEMKENWQIKKSEIKEMGINPNKEWGEITLNELGWLADFLNIRVSDLID